MASTWPVLESCTIDVAAVRPGLLDLLGDGALGGPLDVPVEGQLDVGAGHGGLLLLPGGGHLAAVGLGVADLAVLAGELLVELLLEAAGALALGVDEADDAGGEVAGRVDPLGVRLVEDPASTSAPSPGGLGGEGRLEVLDLVPRLRGLLVGR